MAEKLATLRQRGGGGIESNLFSMALLDQGSTSWTNIPFSSSVNDPNAVGVAVTLDPNFGHIANNSIVVDKAIPKAYLTGRAVAIRNQSGATIYNGVQILKNGTVVTGASVMGSSADGSPSFRRIQTSFAAGDVITFQRKASASYTIYPLQSFVNIVTDD